MAATASPAVDGARWSSSTRVPTVVSPGPRWAATAATVASSQRATRRGVASTGTSPGAVRRGEVGRADGEGDGGGEAGGEGHGSDATRRRAPFGLRPGHNPGLPPSEGTAMPASITMGPGGLCVPDEPIIPFIEGDGTGPDIWAAAVRVFDAAVARAYGGRRRLAWKEVLAGEKAFKRDRGVAARGHPRGLPGASRRHQGPADHAGGRRASAASTWPCARCSTSTPACARCAGTAACPRRCGTPSGWTW